ncbi:sigma-70 family RNA polymerase sigma factor [Bdellovibrionota bacterium FG-2]
MDEELSNEALMVAYQKGDLKAFEVLYRRHSGRVYGFLVGKLKGVGMADDVFQATFLKLHQSRASYEASYPFLPWLFTICRNTMIDSLRKNKRSIEELNPVAIEKAQAPAGENTEDWSAIPSLSTLPENQRQALELRYSEELSFVEIAQKLKTSPVNVRQLISRAVKKLRANA